MRQAIENRRVAPSAKVDATVARIEQSIVFDELTYHLFDDVVDEVD